jgi:Fe2+ transport system protein FeoA
MGEKRLSEMRPGEKGKVSKVTGGGFLRRRIMDMGIVKGREINVVRSAPLGDPVEFLLMGYNLTLRKNEAENVYVEVE